MAEKLFPNPMGLPWCIQREPSDDEKICGIANNQNVYVAQRIAPDHAKLICDEVNKTHKAVHPLLSKLEVGTKITVRNKNEPEKQAVGYVLTRNMDGDKIIIELRDGTVFALSHDEFVSRCHLYPGT